MLFAVYVAFHLYESAPIVRCTADRERYLFVDSVSDLSTECLFFLGQPLREHRR